MSMHKFSLTMVGVALVSASGMAAGADEAVGPKLSSDIRASWGTTDNGLLKMEGQDDPATTSEFNLERVKVQFKGNLDQDTEYRFRFDFNKMQVDYASGTWWMNKTIGLKVGQDKIQQGGIYNMTNGVFDLSKPIYDSNKPHSTFAPLAEVQVKVAGTLAVQLIDDHSQYNQWHSVDQQPTFALGYQGEFGGVAPRAQFGSYDNNHSHYASVGTGFKAAGADAYVNVIWDHRSHKDSATAADPKDKYDVLTSVELDGKYAVSKQIQPFFHVSVFNRTQDGTDLKVNSVNLSDANNPALKWDDNGTVVGVGSFYHATEHASPFLAIDWQSGKFPKDLTDVTTAETRSEMKTRLGMATQF